MLDKVKIFQNITAFIRNDTIARFPHTTQNSNTD